VHIATFNRADILVERAINSVLSQTYKNIELIIIDDGSSDNTEAVVRNLCDADARIKYKKISRLQYRYPNKAIYHWFTGSTVAANAGLKLCSGLWIARLDDDDEWTNDHLQKLLKFAQNGNYEFVSSAIRFFEGDKCWDVHTSDDPRDKTGVGAMQTWLYRNYLKKFKYNINCWRKDYFKVNDTDLAERFYLSRVRIGFLPEVTALIKPRPGEEFVGSRAYTSSSKKYEEIYG
jgi:glycosyltransferase involved in cell wall biosynthesis